MDAMLDFVLENYIGFIIGGVVLLLAIVGFIGDKIRKGKTDKEQPIEEAPKVDTKAATESLFGEQAVSGNTQVNVYGTVNAEPKAEEIIDINPTPEAAPIEGVSQYNGFDAQPIVEQPIAEQPTGDMYSPLAGATPEVSTPIETPNIEPVPTTPVVETPVETPIAPTPIEQPIEQPKEETPTDRF